MFFKSILAVATAASGVLGFYGNSTCSQDSCAQAVIATSLPEIHGSADCQSYFGTVTVTAANMTLIQTSTQVLNNTFLRTSTQIANATFSSTSTQLESATVTSTSVSVTTTTISQFASVTKTQVVTNYATVTSTHTTTVTPAQYYKRAIETPDHRPLQNREDAAASSDCVTRTYTTTYAYTTMLPRPTSSSTFTSSAAAQTCSDAPLYADACDSCEKYTSACACVGVTGKTTLTVPGKTLTVTVPVTSTSITTEIILETVTATSTEIIPETTTAIFTSSITETITILETSSLTLSYATTTTTTGVTSAVVSKAALASPTCSSITYGTPYTIKYAGFQTLNPVNPANTVAGAPPISYTFAGSLNVCAAATQCVQRAYTAVAAGAGNSYYTINLQFVDATQSWLCVTYYDGATASYFNVDTPGVSQSYGWAAI